MARHIHSFGGPSVGKGLSAKRLAVVYQKDIFFVTVGSLITERRKNDRIFNDRYGERIDDGYLIPDNEANPMAVHCYETGKKLGHQFFYYDGWGRTAKQIEVEEKLGVLCPNNSIAIILKANREICHQRSIHRRENQAGGPRADDANDIVFNRRWGIFAQNISPVRKAVVNAGVRVYTIDACQDLPIVTELVLKKALTLKPVPCSAVLTA